MAATASNLHVCSRLCPIRVWLIPALISIGGQAVASDWLIAPTLNARAELTDNVGQASDASKQSAFILGVTPGIGLDYKGSSRLKAKLHYSLTGVERFAENENSNDLNHALSAIANAEIVEDLFYLDAHANVSQVLTSLLGAPGGGTLNTGNLTTVGTYSLSPYLIKRFGTFATGNVRYTTSGALFHNSSASNINANTLQASLNSGTRFNDLSWALNYSFRDAAVQNGGNNQFEHYDVTLGYPLTRHVRVFGSAGYDNNDYPSISKTSGPSWNAGLGWSPTRRTSMDASVGHNYFGNTYGAHFDHRSHFSSWRLQYTEGVNDISQQLLAGSNSVIWDCGAGDFKVTEGLTPAPAGCTALGTLQDAYNYYGTLLGWSEQAVVEFLLSRGVPLTSLASGIFLNKTLSGGVSWAKGKNSVGLNFFDTKRIYQDLAGLPGDETRGIAVLYGYRLDPHTTLSASLSFTNNMVPSLVSGLAINRNDDTYITSIGLTRRFQPKLSGSLVYRYTVRNSNVSTAEFTENNFTAFVNMTF